MKNLLLILCSLFLFSCTAGSEEETNEADKAKLLSKRALNDNSPDAIRLDNCSKSAKAAEKAHKYAKRSQNAENFEDIRDNAREAISEFEDARKYADKCGCKNAYRFANDGVNYARQAYRSGNIQHAQAYARDAKNTADELVSEANRCSYN